MLIRNIARGRRDGQGQDDAVGEERNAAVRLDAGWEKDPRTRVKSTDLCEGGHGGLYPVGPGGAAAWKMICC